MNPAKTSTLESTAPSARSTQTSATRSAALRRTLTLAALACALLAASGCIAQKVDLPRIRPEATPGEEFENSGYSVYVLFDLIPVKRASTEALIAEVNPDNKPIQSLTVTSQADPVAVLVNIVNGGIIDRGVLVSLNKLNVKGRFAATP